MPHVTVKMFAGKTDQQKTTLADEVTRAIMKAGSWGADAISVSIEDVAPKDWVEQVYKPEILARPDLLYKKPGYDPL